jgi:hypothetical protein
MQETKLVSDYSRIVLNAYQISSGDSQGVARLNIYRRLEVINDLNIRW